MGMNRSLSSRQKKNKNIVFIGPQKWGPNFMQRPLPPGSYSGRWAVRYSS